MDTDDDAAGASAPDHIAHNVEAVFGLQAENERRIPRHERAIEHVVRIIGRPLSILLTLAVVVLWCVWNAFAGPKAVDPPPFSYLQAVVGVAALLTTAMVLSVQTIEGRRADQRAHLNLQVNLAAEQKIAKLIGLVEELRRDLPNVTNRRDSMAEAMAQPVDPYAVASALEATLEDAQTATQSSK